MTKPQNTQTKPASAFDRPELLAPAGTIDAFFGALEQGADAIYVGTPKFNARLRARNFTFDELSRLVAYAHGVGRKVFVTLNTLVKETELADLVETLSMLRAIAPDALIVQDLAVWRLARRVASEIPLHASTQMTIHNLDGAIEAAAMGFERAILARELTLEEISYIRANSQIELETFIHGALCYSISGQCCYSSYAHGKSANRGACLQPCRRLYDAGADRLPLFAPLDLGTEPILFQLISAGIRSLKIEGRLKPAETISRTVAAYRLLIDAYPNATKETVEAAREHLRLAIGRKRSTGFYLSARPDESMVGDGMSRSGRYLGKISAVEEGAFEITPREDIKVGDRINVQKNRHAPPRNFTVRKLRAGNRFLGHGSAGRPVTVYSPFEFDKGSAVVKVIDADAATEQSKRYDEKKWPKATERSKATFAARLESDDRGGVVLETELDGRKVRIEQWPSWEEQADAATAAERLSQPSDAFPVCLAVEVSGDFEYGVPMTAKELDAMRERALAGLAQRLEEDRQRVVAEFSERLQLPDRAGALPENLARVSALEEATAILRKTGATPILPVTETMRGDFAAWYEGTAPDAQGTALRDAAYFELPQFHFGEASERDHLHKAVARALDAGVKRFFVSNIAHFHILRATGRRGLEVVAGDGLHCLSSEALAALVERGVSSVVYPLEGDRAGLEAMLGRVDGDVLVAQVYGRVPLFRSRQPQPSDARHVKEVVGDSPEKLEILHRGGLIVVVPERVFSLRHRLDALETMGISHRLYDLAYTPTPSKNARDAIRATDHLDGRHETQMNFERGLD